MKDRGAGNEKEKTENFGIESGHGSITLETNAIIYWASVKCK